MQIIKKQIYCQPKVDYKEEKIIQQKVIQIQGDVCKQNVIQTQEVGKKSVMQANRQEYKHK